MAEETKEFRGYEEFKENRAVNGVGAGLYVKDTKDGKYSLAILLTTVPSVAGSYNTIDVDVTGSNTIGKVLGKQTIDEKETEFLLHRDNVRRLNELTGKTLDWLIVTQDKMGLKFTGEIKTRFNDLTSGELATGTLTITASTIEEKPIMNVLPLLKPTVKFTGAIPNEIQMNKTGSIDIDTDLLPSSATCTVKSDKSQLTGSFSVGKVKLTASNATEPALVEITATAEGHAPWTTTILVTFK